MDATVFGWEIVGGRDGLEARSAFFEGDEALDDGFGVDGGPDTVLFGDAADDV